MVNEIILRRVKDKPILNLIIDGQEGSAGIETRLESFLDIIQFKRMIIMSRYKVSFPHLGNYYIPLEILFTEGLEVDYIIPPSVTKRTLELGTRYSPDAVCAPFKYTLGNFIETLELGANTLVQAGGVCRLGYYGELDEQILRDLGYDVKFVNFAKTRISKPSTFYDKFKEINPNLSLNRIAKILPLVLKMVEYIDEIEDYVRKNIGFEVEKGSFDSLHEEFLESLEKVRTKPELNNTYQKYLNLFKGIKLKAKETTYGWNSR